MVLLQGVEPGVEEKVLSTFGGLDAGQHVERKTLGKHVERMRTFTLSNPWSPHVAAKERLLDSESFVCVVFVDEKNENRHEIRRKKKKEVRRGCLQEAWVRDCLRLLRSKRA